MTRPGGIVCPIVTPLTADGGWMRPCSGTSSRRSCRTWTGCSCWARRASSRVLPDETAVRAAQVAADQVAERIPVYAGRRRHRPRPDPRARRATRRRAGVDYVVVTPPFYYPVAAGVAAGLVLRDHRRPDRHCRAALQHPPEHAGDLCRQTPSASWRDIPNIVGIKDSAGDPFAFEEFLALRVGRLQRAPGSRTACGHLAGSGADGVISAMGNFAPRLLRARHRVGPRRPATRRVLRTPGRGRAASRGYSTRATGCPASRRRCRSSAGRSVTRARRSRPTTQAQRERGARHRRRDQMPAGWPSGGVAMTADAPVPIPTGPPVAGHRSSRSRARSRSSRAPAVASAGRSPSATLRPAPMSRCWVAARHKLEETEPGHRGRRPAGTRATHRRHRRRGPRLPRPDLILDRFGRCDSLVNAAGHHPPGPDRGRDARGMGRGHRDQPDRDVPRLPDHSGAHFLDTGRVVASSTSRHWPRYWPHPDGPRTAPPRPEWPSSPVSWPWNGRTAGSASTA